MRRRGILALLAGLAGTLLLPACAAEPPTPTVPPGELRVMYVHAPALMSRYGETFMALHPGTTLVPVQYPRSLDLSDVRQVEAFVDEHEPDVVFFRDEQVFRHFVQAGKLTELDPIIQAEKFDTRPYHALALDSFRLLGEGRLYGLSPTFTSYALYINNKLQAEHGLPLLSNKPTWEETIAAAAQAADPEQGRYGLAIDGVRSADDLLLYVLELRGVAPTEEAVRDGEDPAFADIRADCEEWIRRGVVYTGDDGPDRFLAGELYLAVRPPDFINVLLQEPSMQFRLASQPVAAGDRAVKVQLDHIFAIRADSPRQEAAWAFVRHAAGRLVAEQIQREGYYQLLTRRSSAVIPGYEQLYLDAFTAIEKRGLSSGAMPVE